MWGVVAAAAAVVCLPAHADTPLSLTASEDLKYDSNILKDNARKYRDVVSSTGLKVGFNKEYGRQTYSASATAVANKYKNTKDYDNDGYSVQLGMTSSLMSNWYGSINL
ncbi:MAG TPA: hypothetical protein H9903_13640, partial [Candidatus Aquabacterium excrementipullorum]|nr:hypothetical protein [Candidatus Aquabacterium excrementipullorum]